MKRFTKYLIKDIYFQRTKWTFFSCYFVPLRFRVKRYLQATIMKFLRTILTSEIQLGKSPSALTNTISKRFINFSLIFLVLTAGYHFLFISFLSSLIILLYFWSRGGWYHFIRIERRWWHDLLMITVHLLILISS